MFNLGVYQQNNLMALGVGFEMESHFLTSLSLHLDAHHELVSFPSFSLYVYFLKSFQLLC